MQHSRLATVPALVAVALAVRVAAAGPPPTATPTPAPRSLPAYAACRPLADDLPRDRDGTLVISNRTVSELAPRGVLTTAGPSRPAEAVPTPTAAEARTRRRWQAAYRRQAGVVAKLDQKRAALEAELGRLRDMPPTVRTVAREERVREERRRVDHQLALARDELARILRAARREGAQPGWFRE